MHIRLIPILAATLLVSACGNKADLLSPREVPPEDRGRYLFKSSIPTQEQLDAEQDAAWDDAGDDDGVDSDGMRDDTNDGTTPPVPVILDVPAATGTP